MHDLDADVYATAEVAGQLDTAIAQIVEQLAIGRDRGLAVRSSTNAEDLSGFSGAGIYASFLNVRGAEALSHAIRDVWASVWNQRAYEERSFYGSDHRAVFGAVLEARRDLNASRP